MFDKLSQNIDNIFSKLKGRGVLNEKDIDQAMREIRVSLLEADVSLLVVKDFIKSVKEKALGEAVIKSVTPAQMIVKIVNDELKNYLGGEDTQLKLKHNQLNVILMCGLQGSGKTTSSAKLGHFLKNKHKKKVITASLDIYRPAAQEQLKLVSEQAGIDNLEIIAGQKPLEITKRAVKEAKLAAYDVLILDSAGRTNLDETLMQELISVKEIANPDEIIFVADALTGQDAVNIAKAFNEAVNISSVILTRMDSDTRGGAALSIKYISGAAIKFIGIGEKISEFQEFYPDRVASRILNMGDIVSLVEKAQEQIDEDEAKKMMNRVNQGQFDFNDLYKQLKTISKMGGFGSIMGMIPGMSKIKDMAGEANLDGKMIKRQLAIIESMTKKERKFPKLLNASRKKRIASGCGLDVADVNKLLKQQQAMEKTMKKIRKAGGMKKFMNPQNLQQLMGDFKPR